MGRRLAAILVADIVGYSRLMGKDEAGTIRRLKALRRDVTDPAIKATQGRIVKAMGDGLLVEFPSPLRAVTCAVRIQRAMADWEATLPDDKCFRLRFGINVGDVVAQPDGDLFGDGVNVAARLEPLSEPGGLCVSRSVHDQVRDKLPYRFEDRGKLELKNIARPVGVFTLSADAVQALAAPDDEEDDAENAPEPNGAVPLPPPQIAPNLSRRLGIVGLAPVIGVVALAFVGVAAWSMWPGAAPKAENTLAVQNGLPAKPLPPLSLVVLPFANLSNDPERDFFADGLTEDLTTDLSHLAGSFVIARNTAFTYKGKAVDVKQLGRDLGVRYVLEGSVRRTGDRVVLNAQLISTETGAHIWADRFEGDRGRLGEIQAEFVARLARSLDVQLTQAESLRIKGEKSSNPTAADLGMLGWAELNKPRSRQNALSSIDFFDRSLEIEPDLMRGLLGRARGTILLVTNRWSDDRASDLKRVQDLVDKVVSINPSSPMAAFVKAEAHTVRHEFDLAISMYEDAIRGDPNFPEAYGKAGNTKILMGRAAEAFDYIYKAIRISPQDPVLNIWYYQICHAHSHLQHWNEAIDWCSKSIARGRYWIAFVDLAVAYAWTGKVGEAHKAVSELQKLMPGYTVQKWANAGWSENPRFLEEYQYLIKGLRMAGLPEGSTN